MNFKSTKIRQQNPGRSDLILFGVFHSLIWLIVCSLWGWWGILYGFLVNCMMDTGIFLSWMWQEKKRLSQEVAHSQKKNLIDKI